MAHSVIITTPMPTLDEIGQRLGLSKAERESLIRLVEEKATRRSKAAVRKATSASRGAGSRRAGVSVKRKANRARATA